ncbi:MULTISPECIES: hypothetical protein [Methylobacterium]|uniref:Uncharacterized protein n=1 Tax=Methylobacterium jeotgali TaxID=381630 RepID=A0ABQ4SUL5_9HYPH|nr:MULTISPECIES: hypothetical protein [Methylobacterium]PIU07280.1 MAG: hypothetical protein COT56_05460 [Methylobacterium sp. CG09_land_8_20_14_0_10_71_15]PIU11425.1 MAG: hypothetical protein COT28_20055 [Methylobacterium sp. CG08_land_8_20_14_0_20_71_15]GBU17817.1 hypothetical protein AwMethylo_20320 [Methylobacterium sp.]GJE06792.1 hypothetical protein AOPFMNJM_2114 [Methylobacterium jeotgali]
MARLRRSPVSTGTTPPAAPPPAGADGLGRDPRADGLDPRARLDGAAPLGERGGRGSEAVGQGPGEEGVELDAAIDAMLAAGGVDAVTRVRLSEARRAIAEAGAGEAEVFEGASLSRSLFRFVMPRLHHPEVLRGDRHRALLEGLAEGLAAESDDGIVREGALVVHRELRRLAMLRASRNALIEG